MNYFLPHIAITVSDINSTKDFYTKIGFSVKVDTYSEEKKRHFLLLEGYKLEFEIFHFDKQSQNQQVITDLQKAGLQHIALPVEDLERKKQELLTKEISLTKDITVSSMGVRNINIVDPSGIIIEFFEVIHE